MKKLILLITLLFANTAQADSFLLPNGCYVTYANPNYCYSVGAGNVQQWFVGTDQAALIARYGSAVAIIIQQATFKEIEAELCIDDYNGLVVSFNRQLKKIKRLKNKIRKLKRG